jgi:type I restriction enzyme S subunit
MPRAKWPDIAKYKIPWAGQYVAQDFNELVQPLAGRVEMAVSENRSLAQLRDTLLPELMSGEIRVRDAEKAVEEAT